MKAKLSHRLFVLFTLIASAFCFSPPASAASFSMTASATQVAPGASFTVSVGGDCVGRVNLKATGGTASQSAVWVEENRKTVTVTAGNSGTITVTATPEAGFSDSDGEEFRPGSRTVSVKIVAPAQTTASIAKPTTTATSQNQAPEETKTPEEVSPSEDVAEDDTNAEDAQETDDNTEAEIVETNPNSCPDNDSTFAWILVGVLIILLCGVTTALVCVLVTYKTPEQKPAKKAAKHEKLH